jgi:hypothetical protein
MEAIRGRGEKSVRKQSWSHLCAHTAQEKITRGGDSSHQAPQFDQSITRQAALFDMFLPPTQAKYIHHAAARFLSDIIENVQGMLTSIRALRGLVEICDKRYRLFKLVQWQLCGYTGWNDEVEGRGVNIACSQATASSIRAAVA